MQRPLDAFRFKQNHYDRPNQDWVCGHAAEGRRCPLGPDERGNCRHTGECMPAQKGDRWLCTRTDASGGKCAEGPLPDGACAHPIPPCQPVPSLRRARSRMVWLVVALTTGALLFLLGGAWRQSWTDPGDLTNVHATSAAKCSDCHALERSGPPPLATLASLNQRRLAESALCLKCHALGDHPLEPHGVAPARLVALQRKAEARPNEPSRIPLLLRASRALNPIAADAGQLACATCHQEHRGRRSDLKRLSDAQCQSCHASQFASFEQGHPEFGQYPYEARTRIFFDHASHLRQHFAERKDLAPRSCADCHVPEPSGRFMQVKNFNQTCAACHAGQIQGEGMTVKGVAFFTVPGLDADTLAARGISIGEWPKFADGKVTPFMELLLDRQPAVRAAQEKLRGVDLLDLTNATPAQLAAAGQLAWGVKTLLSGLVVEGQSYLMKEMKGDVAPAGLEVPRATLIAAQKEWLPHLLGEVANYEKGITPRLPERARPTASPTPSPNEKAPAGDEPLLGGDDLTTAATPSPAPASSPGAGNLLAGGNDDLAAATPPPAASPAAGADLTSGDLLGAAAPSSSSATATPPPEPAAAAKPAEDWVAAGGWYRPAESFTLFYRPVGHADPFLVAWLTAAAQLSGKPAAPDAQEAFQKLTDPQSPGLCTKCHTTVERRGTTLVQWVPIESEPKGKSFTTFNHTAHLSLMGDTGCQMCHALNPKSDYAKYFTGPSGAEANRDASRFASNFSALSGTVCLQCHQPKVAGDACLLCHRYHTEGPVGGLVTTSHLKPALMTK